MDCTQTRLLIDEVLSGTASPIQAQAVSQHVEGCATCAEHLRASRELMLQLREMTVPEPSSDFEQRVLAGLDARRRPHSGFVAGFATALVASLLLWAVFVGGPALQQADVPAADVPTVTLVASEVRRVNLVFNAPAAIESATISLELPAAVSLDGYPGRRSLRWTTTLKAGANRLSLPLRADGPVEGVLIARLTRDGKTREFKVRIDARGADEGRPGAGNV
ncbi:MAG TPA: hypothetical protein ENJ01_09420 [Gammaproteobacteria bacterium]|nr:hypothetical protein [Gammaproteobacteria bacterium]